MDWNLIRAYLSVAEHGSTLAASRHLEVTQSTISRHLAELEKQLSVQLFDRRKTGLALTDKGRELLSLAQQMDGLAADLQAEASHFSEKVSGTVRISASEAIASEVLPHCIVGLLDENPELQIEIVASNEASNLLSREADIAVRNFKPTQQDLIFRRLPDVEIGFFAHRDYLEKQGRPDSVEAFRHLRVIGFDVSTLFIDGARKMGINLQRNSFTLRSDSTSVQTECVKAGLGVAVLQKRLMEHLDFIEELKLDMEIPPMPLYLVAQQELRSSRKLRTVFDGLLENLLEFYRAA